jgi:hypothetical protein
VVEFSRADKVADLRDCDAGYVGALLRGEEGPSLLDRLPTSALPAGSSGVVGHVFGAAGARPRAVLSFEPGGVLGEEAHDRREVVVVLSGSVSLERWPDDEDLDPVQGRDRYRERSLSHREALELGECDRERVSAGEVHRLVAGPEGALVACWWAP